MGFNSEGTWFNQYDYPSVAVGIASDLFNCAGSPLPATLFGKRRKITPVTLI
jgi:hypothetical protein